MTYVVLARKHRPRTFNDLIGQEHVNRTLSNALRDGRVAHAYLFSGPRGVGKTTTARLLAKALNCVKGPTAEPCGACEPCRVIAEGQSQDDVLEIDAASNRGINEVKEICENVRYTPSHMRYRITIIDEAHQITKEGFNALLKTLEEPPPHAVFMLATTEAHKVPSTISSRCQRFQFRPLTIEEITGQLEKISSLEALKVEPAALSHIARAASGSVRDALSLMDQVATFSPDGAGIKDVEDILGLLPRKLLLEMAELLNTGTPEKLFQEVQEVAEAGYDYTQLARELQDHFHKILLAHYGASDDKSQNVSSWPPARVEKILHLTARLIQELRYTEFPRIVFELYGLKCIAPAEEAPPRPAAAASHKKSADEPVSPPPGTARQKEPLPHSSEPKEPASPVRQSDEAWDPAPRWAEVLEKVGQISVSVSSALGTARVRLQNASTILLTFSNSFPRDRVQKNTERVQEAIQSVYGRPVRVEYELAAARPAPSEEESVAEEISSPTEEANPVTSQEDLDEPSPAADDPHLKKVLAHFPGRVRNRKNKTK